MKTKDIIILTLSFALLSAAGMALLWNSSPQWGLSGPQRAGIFVFAMIAVHAVGGVVYARQLRREVTAADDGVTPMPVSPKYWPAIKVAMIQQAILFALCALTLDGGEKLKLATAAVLAHWLVIALVLAGRPRMPTTFDIGVIKYGFVPLIFFMGNTLDLLRGLRGE